MERSSRKPLQLSWKGNKLAMPQGKDGIIAVQAGLQGQVLPSHTVAYSFEKRDDRAELGDEFSISFGMTRIGSSAMSFRYSF